METITKGQGMIAILGMMGVIILMIVLKQNLERLLDYLLRGVFGCVAICVTNMILASAGLQLHIGVNLYTFLTSTIFGVPGIALLYGIGFIS